ncbi:hypothetical protein LTR56_007244 [Elasticomyces elasticus]|nr:hypothetical protein LTR56_007244 [Elasticomyces elasticus]KAK4914498.1 hypothetical protein LTR49_017303 [Elasticomyces elasticus]KAK5753498.1 hypothetical protein LTS12_016450 [Elasticomyces elasticus]
MPPKASKKAKAEPKEETPEPSTPNKTAPKKAAASTPKTTTPKKPKEAVVYQTVDKVPGSTNPLDVMFQGASTTAGQIKDGSYSLTLKVDAPSSFSVYQTYTHTEGPYEGFQAILLRPAKAFPFLKLPKELRLRIYGFYFAQKGVVGEGIVLDGKRANKEAFAKTYAESMKNRVGVLAVNKEIHEEAIPIFYAHQLRFESTTSLLDFLSQIPQSVRPLLKNVYIKNWIKTSSRNAMHCLSDSPNLTKLHIDASIFGEGDPNKAAKQFYNEAYKLLEAIGSAKGEKTAGVDILEFGKTAFQFKDDKKTSKPWSAPLIEEFKENLRSKLQ